jgi:hypothetical protein
MNKFILVGICLFSASVFSASVKVDSFNYAYSGPLAELCGTVSGATSSPSYITVKIDPGTPNSAVYNTLAGQDGKFCVAAITYRGRAEVSLFGVSNSALAVIK